MAQTKTISGNDYKNVGSTLLNGGTTTNPKTNVTSLLDHALVTRGGSKVINSSSVGTTKALSSGVFASYEAGKYVMYKLGSRLAGTDNTFLLTGVSHSGVNALHLGRGNYRYHITGWSYTTGAATKGGNAGDAFTYFDPENNTTINVEPRPTADVPGELVYMYGALTPAMADYKARTLA